MSEDQINRPIAEVRTIRYLGNKRRLLPFICEAIGEVAGEGPALDLFAGTNVVSYGVAPWVTVYTNDLQEFSFVIGRALIGKSGLTRTKQEARRDLSDAYESNMEELEDWLSDPIRQEAHYLSDGGLDTWEEYSEFCNGYPRYPWTHSPENGYSQGFQARFTEGTIAGIQGSIGTSIFESYGDFPHTPYLLFSTYFANGYFGIRQAAEIDSLRCAIDKSATEAPDFRDLYLTALIYALSSSVSSPGHFAQFRSPNSPESTADLKMQRQKSIYQLFLDRVEELFSEKRITQNGVWNFNLDYRVLLRLISRHPSLQSPSVIYADPPYTPDHYSRFYHVLETLVRYDYPESVGIGRYREDREKSGFSHLRRVRSEFKALTRLSKSLGSALILSYCNYGLVDVSDLTQILEEEYPEVETRTKQLNHSSQGRPTETSTHSSNERLEYLFVCSER